MDGIGGGREFQEEGHIHIQKKLIHFIVELKLTHTVKQLYPN